MVTEEAKRRYRLSPDGLESLRKAARLHRPWQRSTGPRTRRGKARSSQNARIHGRRSRTAIRSQRQLWGWDRLFKAAMAMAAAETEPLEWYINSLQKRRVPPGNWEEKLSQLRASAALRIIKNATHLVRWGDPWGMGRMFLASWYQFLRQDGIACPWLLEEYLKVRLVGSGPESMRLVPLAEPAKYRCPKIAGSDLLSPELLDRVKRTGRRARRRPAE